jgi:hypothetical protein
MSAKRVGGKGMSSEDGSYKEKFVDMASAKVEVDLLLSDYAPHAQLKVPASVIEQPRFPVIDFHSHLDAQSPQAVLRVMDACGVEKIVNITMLTGKSAIEIIDLFHQAAPDRFATIGWMDWNGVERSDFIQLSLDRLERLVEHGACGLKLWKDLGLTVRDASGAAAGGRREAGADIRQGHGAGYSCRVSYWRSRRILYPDRPVQRTL